MMSLALNVGNWWESCGDELWATNPRQSNFVTQTNVIAPLGTKLDDLPAFTFL